MIAQLFMSVGKGGRKESGKKPKHRANAGAKVHGRRGTFPSESVKA
jgi:hypothetical protein